MQNVNKMKQRSNSALPNLQTHPCFQSDLFSDGRALGAYKLWKEKNAQFLVSKRPASNLNEHWRKFETKDHQLENAIWSQSVN